MVTSLPQWEGLCKQESSAKDDQNTDFPGVLTARQIENFVFRARKSKRAVIRQSPQILTITNKVVTKAAAHWCGWPLHQCFRDTVFEFHSLPVRENVLNNEKQGLGRQLI